MTDLNDVRERLFRDVKVPSADFGSRALHLLETEEGCALLRDISAVDVADAPLAAAVLFRGLWGVDAPPDFQSVRVDGRSVWNWSDYSNSVGVDSCYTDTDIRTLRALADELVQNIQSTILFVKSSTRRLGGRLSKMMFMRRRAEIRARIESELRTMINAAATTILSD